LGGGGYVLSDMSINFGLIQGNSALTDAGGIFVLQSVQLLKPTFLNNTATHGIGGGLLVGSAITGNGGVFQSNRSAFGGGGMYVTGSVSLKTPQFISNANSELQGGGLFVGGSAVITAGLFQGNDSHSGGGGARIDGPATISATQFLGNHSHAASSGAGLNVGGAAVLAGNLFMLNEANGLSSGGGASFSGDLTSTGDRFISNTARDDGGGLLARAGLTVTGDVFSGNASQQSGGLFATAAANGRIANTLFADNVASDTLSGGAALRLSLTSTVALLNNTFSNASATTATAVVAQGPVLVSNTILVGFGVALSGTGILEDHNLFFANGANTLGAASGGHSFTADPLFVNAAGGDDHLTSGSPALNAGVDDGLTTDFDGDPRPIGAGFDIGFDEFVTRLFLPFLMR
jgi:hypothetical protein